MIALSLKPPSSATVRRREPTRLHPPNLNAPVRFQVPHAVILALEQDSPPIALKKPRPPHLSRGVVDGIDGRLLGSDDDPALFPVGLCFSPPPRRKRGHNAELRISIGLKLRWKGIRMTFVACCALREEVDGRPSRHVVDAQRQARVRHRLEVPHEPAPRRLDAVRRDHE